MKILWSALLHRATITRVKIFCGAEMHKHANTGKPAVL